MCLILQGCQAANIPDAELICSLSLTALLAEKDTLASFTNWGCSLRLQLLRVVTLVECKALDAHVIRSRSVGTRHSWEGGALGGEGGRAGQSQAQCDTS